MPLALRRLILFTPNLARMTAFYRDVLGLPVCVQEQGWVELDAGGCRLALHAGASAARHRSPKMAFYASDVALARSDLVKRGLTEAGAVKSTGSFDLCDCKDPDGNPFQISSRT